MFDYALAGVLKSVADAGWGVWSGGDGSTGFGSFTIVEIPEDAGARAEMRGAVFKSQSEAEAFDNVEAGWYLYTHDSEEVPCYMPCRDKEEAEQVFHRKEKDYKVWAENRWRLLEGGDKLADHYAAFMQVGDYAEAKQFVRARLAGSHSESTLFEADAYRFDEGNPFIAGLMAEQVKALQGQGMPWGIFARVRLQSKFQERMQWLQEALDSPQVWERAWSEGRYDLRITDADLEGMAEEQLTLSYWWKVRESYRWEHVDPETMVPVTGRKTGLVFLVDKETGAEAPLLPGRKPFLPGA